MRTTIDMPDDLYRKTKALAALQGASMKAYIVAAIEDKVAAPPALHSPRRKRSVKLPGIRLKQGRKLDLAAFNFDELLLG